jgi:hypothetical protein
MLLNLINKIRLIRSQCCHYFARGGVLFVYQNITLKTELVSLNNTTNFLGILSTLPQSQRCKYTSETIGIY